MKKLEITVFEKGFENGNIIEVTKIFPAKLDVDRDHIGDAKWFTVSQYNPVTDEYDRRVEYSTNKYCYTTNYR